MKKFWCEVSLEKLQNNLDIIRKNTEGKLMAVVKGNAYGLGIEGITEFLKDKVDYFAVSDLSEVERVRGDKEILLLSPLVDKEDFKDPRENLIYTIDNEDVLEYIDKDLNYKVHLYIDTGMNRMGIKPEELDKIFKRIKEEFHNITVDGVYTHLHNTKNRKATLKQIKIFKEAVSKYIGIIPHIHCLNSSGFLNEEYRKCCDFTNITRVGNILYGYDGQSIGLKKIFCYKAHIINTYKVKKGQRIGYGSTYKAKKHITLGILGFGNIEHFGFNKDVKHNIFYDFLKVVYNHLVKRPVIFSEGKGVEIIGKPNMNITIINAEGIDKDKELKVDITPILADSAVQKKYI